MYLKGFGTVVVFLITSKWENVGLMDQEVSLSRDEGELASCWPVVQTLGKKCVQTAFVDGKLWSVMEAWVPQGPALHHCSS